MKKTLKIICLSLGITATGAFLQAQSDCGPYTPITHKTGACTRFMWIPELGETPEPYCEANTTIHHDCNVDLLSPE